MKVFEIAFTVGMVVFVAAFMTFPQVLASTLPGVQNDSQQPFTSIMDNPISEGLFWVNPVLWEVVFGSLVLIVLGRRRGGIVNGLVARNTEDVQKLFDAFLNHS